MTSSSRFVRRLTLTAVFALAVTVVGCAQGQADPDAQPADDWEVLFDGTQESMEANWRGYRMPEIPEEWAVVDGALDFSGQEPQQHHLTTKKTYGDMELELEWKISEGDNSGIFYLVTESEPVPEYTGPEFQIVAGPTAGGNFDMHDPTVQAANPAGEWNSARIRVEDSQVTHWINDEQVVTYELGSAEWEELKADSKFDGRPYGLYDRGYIVLQDHGNPAWFRNVRVRSLE